MSAKMLILSSAILALSGTAHAQYNPAASCSIGPAEFQGWFANNKISKDGPIVFANSLAFPQNNTKCDFYKWGQQMFLWLTSPSGSGITITSPQIYNVNFNTQGQGIYIQGDDTGFLRSDKSGEMTAFRSTVNNMVVKGLVAENIQPGGQAGGNDALMSLNGSLVYYAVHANDVYAWFNTAVINGALPETSEFPNSAADLNALLTYVASKGASLKDADALTMEIKTSWIDAAKVNGSVTDYVTITADVPNYQGDVGAAKWTIGTPATVTKQLALVGMHVVGTVQGHPEMVWATFEHKSNAPNNTYYLSFMPPLNQPIEPPAIPFPYNSAGQWNFMQPNGSQDGALVPQMTVDGDGNVVATAGNVVGPNNSYRVNPWGSLPEPASANNNTQIFTLNANIDYMLANTPTGKDVRSNYIQIGSVWTRNGSIPAEPTDKSQQVGSLFLANTTMETYHQKLGPDIKPAHQNGCFGCHNLAPTQGSPTPPPTSTSHLFSTDNVPLVGK
ncbi:hypothetical protein GAO09_16140 [Rhizobiales bacterium RZME27]|uniref:Cytochrome c domain-containing protein n=1 Tax=Endobacterium cereale TaxID=2663029 RepID=A0A6A8A8I3_9HYPH|nr:hypothetical protein [Endobacterium cereale]MEB2847016.1 hypothetical protein [Endobacterium cereale]MQY47565.1 hypothetical protein [Endobacterium cereale]